jgi:hypothetical protein
LDVGKRALALKSRLKATAYGRWIKPNYWVGIDYLSVFYKYTDFSKITERKKPEHTFSRTTTLAKRGCSK